FVCQRLASTAICPLSLHDALPIFTVLTRADVDSGLAAWGIHPATFQHLAVPGRSIVGTVRDKRTGKPIAGTAVTCDGARAKTDRSEEHTSELQSRVDLVCRLLLEK